jgi:hypothetical protein
MSLLGCGERSYSCLPFLVHCESHNDLLLLLFLYDKEKSCIDFNVKDMGRRGKNKDDKKEKRLEINTGEKRKGVKQGYKKGITYFCRYKT